jgi:hypothetical protein
MIWVAFITAHAWQQQSNMWPITMIFASPVAILFLLILGVVGLVMQTHPSRRPLIASLFAVVVAACLPYVYMFAVAR